MKIYAIIQNFVHDQEKFDEASMKRRWSFDDGPMLCVNGPLVIVEYKI